MILALLGTNLVVDCVFMYFTHLFSTVSRVCSVSESIDSSIVHLCAGVDDEKRLKAMVKRIKAKAQCMEVRIDLLEYTHL
jgi:hypothetical protein